MSFVPLSACNQTCKAEDQAGPNAHMLIGAVVSGPGLDDAFPDVRTDWLRNNVSITYNAGFQSTVAGTCTSFTHYLKWVCQHLLGFIFSFNVTLLWLQNACWRFCACQCVLTYLMKLGTMFAIKKIPPATRSNYKQNILFQNKLIERRILFDVWLPNFTFQALLYCRFWTGELGPYFKELLAFIVRDHQLMTTKRGLRRKTSWLHKHRS